MVELSYNGWIAGTDPKALGIVPLTVAGVSFAGGVKGGDVHAVLGYIAQQFNDRVEPLVSPGCWGWSYRQNRNADNLSCHSSGTAIDCNAPKHPNGVTVARTFTAEQIAEVHQILEEIPELADAVHWGGDWTRANGLIPDSMHFEIHTDDQAVVRRVANRIRNLDKGDDDMPYTDWPQADKDALAKDVAAAILNAVVDSATATSGKRKVRGILTSTERLAAQAAAK